MAKVKEKATKGTMKKVLRYIGKYKLLLPISIILAIITVALTLYIPVLIGEALDVIGADKIDFSKIRDIIFKAVILILLTSLSQWCMSGINNKVSYNVALDMRCDAFTKLHRLPLSYLDKKSRGDTLNRVVNDTEQFTEGLLLGFTQLFTGIMTIIGTLVFMIILNPLVTVAVVVLTPLSLFIARFIATRTYGMFKKRSIDEAATTAYIEEMIGNQKLVKAFSHEDEALSEFDNINKTLEKSTLDAIFYSSLTNPSTRFVNNLVYAAVALVGALIAIFVPFGAVLTIGQLGALLSYANQYTKPFNEISGVMTEFQNALASASRVFELVEQEPEPADTPDATTVTAAKGNIEFKNVCFSYTPDKPLIKNLNLSVKSGSRVAIVGPTGCGKTTLINLLMRFYDVTDGKITLDGVDIRDITRESLRENFGMVLQDTWLMHASVKENIRMGKPNATDEEIIEAAKATHAHSFIKRLKCGYDTVIGEVGDGLSQGQRQLLCITRVMLSLPPMLILDEATSSIDTRTELRIAKTFTKMMAGRTSFIVAHRLSTVKDADLILVMKDGDIIETGTHEQLLKSGIFYRTLYESQFAH